MNYDDGLFDLRQVEAITSDLRMLCQDLADRLHKSDPGAALEFADNLVTRKISADTFVELFRDNIVGRLDPDCPSANDLRQIGVAKIGVSGPSLGLI